MILFEKCSKSDEEMEGRIMSLDADLSIDRELGLEFCCIPPHAEFVVMKDPLNKSWLE